MDAVLRFGFPWLLLACLFASACLAIKHERNLIWAQTPALRLTMSRLVGIEGLPDEWVPAKKPSVKHISAPHFGWEFRALGFCYNQQLLVWSEGLNKKIQALVLNGSTETLDIFTGTSPEVNGLAVDWLSHNVYWADALYNWVIMAPLRPQTSFGRVNKIVVQEQLDNPHGLVVHPAKNWLFLSDWGARPRIERMDLLGQDRQPLVETDLLEPRGLTLDVVQGVLYWVDSGKDTVERLTLEGLGQGTREVLRRDPGTSYFSLAIFRNYVFVTEQTQGMLKVFKSNSTSEAVGYTLGNVPHGIVMYDEEQQPGNPDICPNYGCQQICVLNETGNPMCLCGEGFNIKEDLKTCQASLQFVHPSHLYAIGAAICMYPANLPDMSLDNVTLTSQCFLNDRYGYKALTFDYKENMLYYSSNVTGIISRIPLETGAKAQVVASGTGEVIGLALDWVSGNLYWTDSTNRFIKVSQKNGRYQKILLDDDIYNPLGIAVHPKRGQIYWTDLGSAPDVLPRIESANMDGSAREILVQDNLGQPNHVFIDYDKDRLYWTDSVLNHIREYDLVTRMMKVFFSLPKVKFYGLSLYKDFVLWTDSDESNGIHAARLDTQRKVRGIIHPSYGVAADLITFDSLEQPDLASPCEYSLCNQLCLPSGSNSYTCDCGLGFGLLNDTTCSVASYAEDNFILVGDAYQRNVYQVDATRLVIAAMSSGEQHEPIALDFQTDPQRLIYWSDNTVHVLRRKPLAPWAEAETFYTLPAKSVVDGIAIDSHNNLLFYTDTGLDLICVLTTSAYPPKRAVLVSEGLDEPRDIVVSPPDGMMYWTDWGNAPNIMAATMTGEDREVLVNLPNGSWPNGLAIDIKGRNLYWADAKNNEIKCLQLGSRTELTLVKEPSSHYFGLHVMGDFLYVTDWKRRFVARMHKMGGALMQFGEDKFTKLYGITGYNSSEAPPGGKGICAGDVRCDNTSICLPQSAAGYVCVCIDGFEHDGTRCIPVKSTTPTASTTVTTITINTKTAATTTTATIIKTTTTTTTPTTTTVTQTTSGKTLGTPTTTTSPKPLPTVPSTAISGRDDQNTVAPITNNSTAATTAANGSGEARTLFPPLSPASPNDRRATDDADLNHVVTRVTSSPNGSDASGDQGESNDSADRSGGTTVQQGATIQRPMSGDEGLPHSMKTGMIVAGVVVGVAFIIAFVLGLYFHYRRQRSYIVPHTRLHEDGREPLGNGSGAAGTSSGTKVVYARYSSSDSIHFDDGFENPTYGVTSAMLLKTSSGEAS